MFQGVHLQKCGEVLRCFRRDTSNLLQTSPRSSAQQRLLQHYERSGFPFSPQLIETSKPGQNHLMIKESLGRTEYLINTEFTLTNSFKTNTITGNSSYRKELLDKALAMIVVPLFNYDTESLELFIQMNRPTNKRNMISSTLTKGDAYIALCKIEKRKC